MTEAVQADLEAIYQFLGCRTPEAWIKSAMENLPILLIDHAQCEKKAASTAMSMMYRYVDKPELLTKMSKLAREELVHFDQVLKIMKQRNIEYGHLSAARYAGGLHQHIRKQDPGMLIDKLIIGAFVEARSCERFAALLPVLDDELAAFYRSLLKSEARHFRDYLKLADLYTDESLVDRVQYFREIENLLIESDDTEFRFHSGVLQ
ncbi:tRNA-(ms[2]io[6]A)-hydroxylase [Gynuella sunshinyii]|uniref:Hydroxylase for synthesis of 2-methylthio-cis-ribozeatin in tRNA n=1 Tax=Gynuella sunshinyii YC6258 TaxID=1445510 RepID=A0A0C5VNH0_9GAMM|nr:tRNA-(ms[2]io[6]A)-hydroxylase [Gynuella sunshinyii]AJQ95856.1 hydroxylase for synthesis of 2-methylthio-cis-ribozeatin in tRNA [Gynuella sunshinyii YC6258]